MTDTETSFWQAIDEYADKGDYAGVLATMGVFADWLEEADPERGARLRWLYDHGKYPHKPEPNAPDPQRYEWRHQWNWYWPTFRLLNDMPEHAVLGEAYNGHCDVGYTASQLLIYSINHKWSPS